jgi:pimeloyl-ACP methyl ester carboxylesterase
MHHSRVGDIEIAWDRRGDGPTVVFVQGVGATGRAWSPQVDELSRGFDCVWFDNRGIGASERGTAPLTVDQLARDTIGLMDALGVERAHLVGHSLGGVIAQAVALRWPGRVRSLALLNTFAGGRDLHGPPLRLMWYGAWSRLGPRAIRRRAFARLVLPDDHLREVGIGPAMAQLEAVFGRSLADPPPITDVQLAALRAHDERDRLRELTDKPCLVLSGAADPIARAAAGRALAFGIGGAHLIEHTGGHALPVYAAAEVNALLRAHLAGASPR